MILDLGIAIGQSKAQGCKGELMLRSGSIEK